MNTQCSRTLQGAQAEACGYGKMCHPKMNHAFYLKTLVQIFGEKRMRLGSEQLVFSKILLKNKLATFEQVSECIQLFEKEPEGGQPLEEIFLQKKYLSTKKLQKARKATERTLQILGDIVYGKLAIEKGYTTEEKVQECFSIQKSSRYKITLPELLLLKDYITEEQHWELSKEQKDHNSKTSPSSPSCLEEREEKKSFHNLKFGEIALKRLLVTSEQVEECLSVQEEMRKRGISKKLGEVMIEKSYISDFQVKKIIGVLEKGEGHHSLIESYLIEKKIGEGAMGVVFKAYLEGTDQPIALKVLRPYIAESRETLKRFAEEAKKAIALNHPNLVRAYEVGVSEDYYYYTMEYVEGESVRQILERDLVISVTRSVKIITDVALALEYASGFNILHRDIKPDNIIVEKSGGAKLCDLGIAKDIHTDSDLTQAGMVVGTPYYISPELAKGRKDIDHRSDLYSLGITFYKMITGQVPFDGTSATSVLVQHLTAIPVEPKEIRPEIPSSISNIVMRLLEKKPADRVQSATELIKLLKKALS